MAGQIPGFRADVVRAGLRLAMSVGLPVDSPDGLPFYFPRPVTNAAPADDSGVPFDTTARPIYGPPTVVRVPCGVEYFDREGKIENFGVLVPSRVELTLLDQEYAKVRGFEYVVIGGARYFYQRTATPLGLVSVGVHVVYCVAEDQM